MKQTPSPGQSLGGTVPEQSGGSVFQPKHAVLHHTETQCLRDLSLEKGALKVVCCNEKTNSRMITLFFPFFFHQSGHPQKKNKRKRTKSEWLVYMVHDVSGDISKAADTLVLYRTVWGERVCTVNVCDWLTGSHGDNARDGWYQPCCGLNGLSGAGHAHLFPPPKGRVKMLRDRRFCCLEGKWKLDLQKLLRSLYDRSFFLVFLVQLLYVQCVM